MNILSICNEPGTLNIIRIVVLLINIIKIVVPIILIVFLVIKIMGAVSKQNQEEIAKTIRSSIPNIVAAVLIFLVPTFVDIVARLSFPNSDYAKCISDINKEKINTLYEDKMSKLLSTAEESEKYSDYAAAKLYLSNIKDSKKRTDYESRLAALKELIDSKEVQENETNRYADVNYSNFKWTAYYSGKGPANKYYSGVLPYLVWAPENVSDLNGVSLPLIVWLHGSGELSYNISIYEYVDRSLPKVVNNWKKSGLDNIPAIIVAPQAAGHWASKEGNRDKNLDSIKAIIESAKEIYNIDTNKIALMGHSLGARGVTEVAYEMRKKYSTDYFSKLVTMSGGEGIIYPSRDSEDAHSYFSTKDVKGFGEPDTASKKFYDWINKSDDYRLMENADHGTVTSKAMLLDENNDGVSDLVYWMFGKNEHGGSAYVKPEITKRFFIGDSRTVNMFRAVYPNSNIEGYELINGTATVGMDTWSCQSAMGYSWMVSTGIPNVESKLDQNSALIILMGVNSSDVDNYIKYFNEKLPEWKQKGINVYFVSVMPTKGNYNYLNDSIKKFNEKIQTVNGLNYIDVYSYMMKEGFESGDGLHFSDGTSKKVYNYIINHL